MKRLFAALVCVFSIIFGSFFFASSAVAISACDADVNQDTIVDISDYAVLVANFFKTGTNIAGDINKDGLVDISDYGVMVTYFLQSCSPAPTATLTPVPSPAGHSPTPAPSAQGNTWYQDAGNAQRTGFTTFDPGNSSNWQFVWSWNGPDSNGGTGGHFYDIGRSDTRSLLWEGRTVVGNGNVYVPALSNGVYALSKTNGGQVWKFSDNTSFKSTPAYDPGTNAVYAGAENGKVYKINASNGSLMASYSAGSPIKKSVLVVGNAVYVVTDAGDLHKILLSNMSLVWKYQGGSKATTPPSYSANKDVLVFATYDLNVHAVQNSNGSQKWKTKPTTLNGSEVVSFEGYWPVVAEQHEIVFLRLNVGMSGLWSGPGEGNRWPNTMSEIRQYLTDNPQFQNLFALDLGTGSKKFIPAVGPGGVEGVVNNGPQLWNGPVPVVKVTNDGKEVAYQHFRNGQGVTTDGRWDSHLGEMVLDNSTFSGMSAGDLRFVQTNGSMSFITDEQTPLSMANNMLFYAHWGASEGHTILDRSSTKGGSFSNPITTRKEYPIIRRIEPCGTKNASTHKTTCGMTLFDDGKYWGSPGWWTYWGVLDPPTPHRGAYSEGILPRYTYASDGIVVVEGNGGELMVFKTQ